MKQPIIKKLGKDLPDLLEPLIDEASRKHLKGFFGEFIDNMPILKWLSFTKKLFDEGKEYWRYKKLRAFIKLFETNDYDYSDFKKLDEHDKQDIRSLIINELDAQTTEAQAQALSYIVLAYLQGKIHRVLLEGVAHEIKNTNPLVFKFGLDGFGLAPLEKEIQIHGPTQYLPVAFITNITAPGTFSSQQYLSNLGQVFFEHVYGPMQKDSEAKKL